MLLNGIHEGLFGPIEDDDSRSEDNNREQGGVSEACDGNVAGSKEAVFHGFNDMSNRIPPENGAGAWAKNAHRVNDRRGVHGQLHAELNQEGQVSVFGGERTENDSETKPEPRHQDDQVRGCK